MSIAENVRMMRENIMRATVACGRVPGEITLVAATKGRGIDEINAAIEAGVKNIGENRVQELVEKYESGEILPVKWHFIGRLQTNKVKYIIDKVDLIHSVDSMKLAEEINRRARGIGKRQDVLVQVNLFEEESKAGIAVEEVEDFIERMRILENVKVRGFTLMAPRGVVTQMSHKCKGFVIDKMQLFCDNSEKGVISYGMTGDYAFAIACGSTMIRIGSGIFGDILGEGER